MGYWFGRHGLLCSAPVLALCFFAHSAVAQGRSTATISERRAAVLVRLQVPESAHRAPISERRTRIRDSLLARGTTSPLLDRMQSDPLPEPKADIPVIAIAPVEPERPWIEELLMLIADAEAGAAGYDAIHHQARLLPAKPPTELTLAEVFDWIAATPRQNHAIGRYQIIPSTLRYLVEVEGLQADDLFSADLQDRLAVRLIRDAGLDDYLSGLASSAEFMDSLAYVWAGLPLANGKSAYEGFAGNKATMSRRAYEDRFFELFYPVNLGMVTADASP